MFENVEFEWDPAKATSNERKHGVAFDFATRVFLDPARLERSDESNEEDRWLVTGRIDDFVFVVVCTFRENVIRLISARKATRYERNEYWHGQIPT